MERTAVVGTSFLTIVEYIVRKISWIWSLGQWNRNTKWSKLLIWGEQRVLTEIWVLLNSNQDSSCTYTDSTALSCSQHGHKELSVVMKPQSGSTWLRVLETEVFPFILSHWSGAGSSNICKMGQTVVCRSGFCLVQWWCSSHIAIQELNCQEGNLFRSLEVQVEMH